MDKPLKYYIKRSNLFQVLQQKIPPLEEYFYIQERFYYNEVANSIEYKELTKIGEHIIFYILKYASILDENDIEALYSYFVFLLQNNYLSYDINKEYDYNLINFNELPILPYITFNSHGKCRHIASLFSNILNKKELESYVLVGVRQELNDYLTHKATILDDPNHAICVTEDSQHTYLLDPSKSEVYFTDDNKTLYSNRFTKFDLKESKKLSFGDKLYFHLTPTKPYKDINEILANSKKETDKLKDNTDIINELHHEIKPALVEAESVYMKILTTANPIKKWNELNMLVFSFNKTIFYDIIKYI